MFKVPEGTELQGQITAAEKNYTLQVNDEFSMEVYANNGERLIDPEFALQKDAVSQVDAEEADETFMLDDNGVTKLPLVNQVTLAGLTLRQAEELLQEEYSKYYKSPFIKLGFKSKRVIVLGASGGQLIPLTYNNTKLVEILAMAKGISTDGKAHNIRVLRGDEVMVADLSTIDGYRKYNIPLQSGDVVYIEPVRKPFVESLRDYAPILTVMTSLTTLIVVINGF
jgi:polysaccharide biosynthesis/export protein